MAKIRVGILTSGGDCPGLNATIRGAAKGCYQLFGEEKTEIIGIQNGYYGLIHNHCVKMSPIDFAGILTRGGTILGTKRTPYKMMQVIEGDNVDKVAEMKQTYKEQKLDCLLTLGGNGTIRFAGSFKPVAINGTVSAGTLISLEGNSLADKQLFTSKLTNLNEVFDVSAVIPSDDYALCTKSSKVTLSKCCFSVNGKKYNDWTVMMNEIAKTSGTVTVELINDANIGSAFKFPSKPKYDKIIINGSGKTLKFKSNSITLTSDTVFADITLESESGKAVLNKKKFDLEDSTAEYKGITKK